MADIEAIGIAVQTDGIEKGIKALNELSKQGPKVESSMAGIATESKKVAKSLADLGVGAGDGLKKTGEAAKQAATGIKASGTAAREAVTDTASLGRAVDSLAKQEAALVKSLKDQSAALQGVRSDVSGYTSSANALAQANKLVALSLTQTVDALKAEQGAMKGVRADMAAYIAATTAMSQSNRQLVEMLSKRADTHRAEKVAISETNASMYALVSGGIQALVGSALLGYTVQATKALYEASAAAQRLQTTLNYATGGNGVKELEYVRNVANKLGLEFQTTAKAYAQFQAASKGTALEGEKARAVFESVAKASAVLGLSTADTSGVLLALQQMISKGTVQAEELRGQLGERLPGAFQSAAKAMGVTTAELGKMLEQGQVIADDFLPKFAAQIEKDMGGAAEKAADRLDAAVNRFANAWEKLKQTAGDSGVSSFMQKELGALANDVTAVTDAMNNLSKTGSGAFASLAGGAGVGAGRAAFGAFNLVVNEFNDAVNAASMGLFSFRTDLNVMPDMFRTNAEQIANMTVELNGAQTKLKRLQELDAMPSNGNYYKSAIEQTRGLINTLQEAINKKRELMSPGSTEAADPTGRTGTRTRSDSFVANNEAVKKSEQALMEVRAKAAGVNKDYFTTLKTLQEAKALGTISDKAYIEQVTQLAKTTWDASTAGKEEAKAKRESTKASNAAATAIKKEQTEYDKLISSIKLKIAEAEEEVRFGRKLSDADKLRFAVSEEGTKKLTAAHKAEAEQLLKRLDSADKMIAATKREVAAYNERIAAQEASNRAYVEQYEAVNRARLAVDELVNSAARDADRLKLEAKLIGASAAQRKASLALYDLEIEKKKELRKLDETDFANDADRQEQRAKVEAAYAQKAANLAGQAYVEEWNNTLTQVEGWFTDTFARIFADGKGGWEAMCKSLKTSFMTLVAKQIYAAFIKPIVVNLVANLSGGGGWLGTIGGLLGMAGGSGGGGNNWLGMASNAQTAYNAYTGQGWAGQAYNTAAGWLGYGGTAPWTAAGVQTSGAVTTPVTGSLGASAPGAGGGYAAVGWAAAAVIAAAYLGGMFKEEKQVGERLTGDLGGDMYGYQLMRESGGLFDGPDYRYVVAEKELADAKARLAELQTGTPYAELGDKGAALREREMQMLYNQMDVLERNYRQAIDNSQGPIKVLQDAYTGMRENTAAKADSLGLDGDSIRAMKVALGVDEIHPDTGGKGLQLTGLTQEEASKKIQEALAQANEELARSVLGSWEEQTREVTRVIFDSVAMPSDGDTEVYGRVGREVKETITEQVFVMSEFVREGETAVQALDRMSGSLVGVNNVFELLGATLLDASLAGGDWASTLVDAIGGMDALTQAASSYFDLYYSDAEKQAFSASRANKGMEDKGLDLRVGDEGAKGKYRELVDKAIADKDEELIAWLLQFADDFSNGVDAVNAAIQEKADELVRIREETVSSLGLSMDGLVDGFITEINEGRGATAGAWLADQIAYGFEEAVYQQGVTAILGAMIDGMITPMVTAAMTGASIADAVSGAAIDNMIANANAALQALNTLLSSVEFIEGMEQIKVTISGLGNSIGAAIPPMRNYSSSMSSVSSSYDRASSAADEAAAAAKKLADEWSKLVDSMSNEMKRLRGELLGGSQDQGMAYYESMFAIKTAQARAGDQEAAGELPSLIKALEDIARENAVSQTDVLLKQAEWLASLTDTRNYVANKYGVDISNQQGAEVAATTTGRVIQTSGNTAVLNALQSSSDNPALLAELRALRAEVEALRRDQRSLEEPQVLALNDIAKTNKRMQMLQEMEAT